LKRNYLQSGDEIQDNLVSKSYLNHFLTLANADSKVDLCGLLSTPKLSWSLSSNSFCSSFSFFGITSLTCAMRRPLRPLWTSTTPSFSNTNCSLSLVPGLRLSSNSPSSAGMVIVSPSAAWVKKYGYFYIDVITISNEVFIIFDIKCYIQITSLTTFCFIAITCNS